jgi:TolB-like protein/DNA-binding winged helix-turn-helix (wHTH) protein
VPLTPKVFDLLRLLVQNSGRLVEKDELLREIWPDSFVEEGNLNRNVSILRKVLGEDASGQLYIETVPKRGYRFVASVTTIRGNGLRAVETGKEAGQVESASEVSEAELPVSQEAAKPKRTGLARRWMVVGGLAVLTLGAMVYFLTRGQRKAHPEIRSIAVLPLQNLSGDPAQEYFADGMTETLINSLAQIRALKVISRTSVMSFKGSKPTLPEIARALGVDGVIEGSVQREGERVKVMIQLIHGPTDAHVWARDYERALTDVLNLQGEMARAIADEIRVQVTPEERTRMASATSVSPAAHEAYLLGRYHLAKFIIDDHKRAIAHFERAIQIDPGYAAAYAGLSMAWQKLGIQGGAAAPSRNVEPQARAAASRVLELDDRLPEAHVALGHLQFALDWEWARAEKSFQRALELDPNNLDAHLNYALLLMALGRFPESLAEIRTAEQVDPLSHHVQAVFGRILSRAGKPEEAVARLKQAIEREPRSANAHRNLGRVYEQMGKYSEAIELYEKANTLRGSRPNDKPSLAELARVYALMGKRTEAKRILADLGDDGAPDAYAALGDNDTAFKILFRRVEERETRLFVIKTDPQFASLHSDPRWPELLRRMNLPVE